MNKKRKQQIEDLHEQLTVILEEEQEYFDNIPENLQSSERYTNSEAAIESLTEAADALENLLNQ